MIYLKLVLFVIGLAGFMWVVLSGVIDEWRRGA